MLSHGREARCQFCLQRHVFFHHLGQDFVFSLELPLELCDQALILTPVSTGLAMNLNPAV